MRVYYVTVLSNFARGYDRYQRSYRKGLIPESTFPDKFFLLRPEDLGIGVAKALRLLDKLGLPGDGLLALGADIPESMMYPQGREPFVWASPNLPLACVRRVASPEGTLGEVVSVEDATAESLACHAAKFKPFAELRPRSVSFLPVAKGCQASCRFCFSEASVSADQPKGDPERLLLAAQYWAEAAVAHGATRAVITGGGEPTMMRWPDLVNLVRTCRSRFGKVVLITNGYRLATVDRDSALVRLGELCGAGLSVLAVSRHHWDEGRNESIMNLRTQTPNLLQVAQVGRSLARLRVRLICVLQKGGVQDAQDVDRYVAWAVDQGVDEVCFKELYVSTSRESVYHSGSTNQWSADHQVPLSVVHEWAERVGAKQVEALPWGAPVYLTSVDGHEVRVAAYTEPSLFWERTSGIARSWNVMSDGTCLASLEDRGSGLDVDLDGNVT